MREADEQAKADALRRYQDAVRIRNEKRAAARGEISRIRSAETKASKAQMRQLNQKLALEQGKATRGAFRGVMGQAVSDKSRLSSARMTTPRQKLTIGRR